MNQNHQSENITENKECLSRKETDYLYVACVQVSNYRCKDSVSAYNNDNNKLSLKLD